MRRLRVWTMGVVMVAAVLGALPASAAPPSTADAEAGFLGRINELRADKGLGPLTVDPELTAIARAWTARMVARGDISHNPRLGAAVTSDWNKLGENVGTGPDVDDLFTAFVRSPHHYVNLVDPSFTRVGIAVAVAPDGSLFTTHDFAAVAGPAPAATPDTPDAPDTAVVAVRPTPHLDAVLDQLRALDAS